MLKRVGLAAVVLLQVAVVLSWSSSDWNEWRGPTRDGVSLETGFPTRWSPAGENLAWRLPYGGRSTPIVMGNRVFLQNAAGEGETLQERVMCFAAENGKLLWEYRFNIFLSDVPPHRVGWASPAGDQQTGNIYAFGVGGMLVALSREGKLVWERALEEEFGLITTHGGRTVSPVIEGNLVIVSGITSGWGDEARGAHRFLAFDKRTGETVWVNSPGGRPFDTTYSPPIAASIRGMRLLIAGGSDGVVHALRPQTGEPVWKFAMSKRGINTGAVVQGTNAFVSHSEENLDSSEMGLLAAIDASATGDLTQKHVYWAVKGFQGGFASPVIDGDRLYQIDNGANLFAFDTRTGKQLWTLGLGTIQRASPVLAQGKLYVGTENGKFFILKPGPSGCEILDEDQLGTESAPEAILASVAVSGGRIYLATSAALYCIGKKIKRATASAKTSEPPPSRAEPSHLQVVPRDVVLEPGESVRFRARLFDAHGLLIREERALWSLDQVVGSIDPEGLLTPSRRPEAQAGQVKATVGNLTGTARVRVIPPLPWEENFESFAAGAVPGHWINARGKFAVREVEGNKVLVKLADNAFTKRARVFMGSPKWSRYSVEVDIRAAARRRQLGDAGVVAQRYQLTLFGNHQRLELQSWQPETNRTVAVPFHWNPDTWYHVKLRVENSPDGKVIARGKAWPVAEAEPSGWSIERLDPIPNRRGSPGIYADAHGEIFFDNLKVTANE